MTFKGKVKRTLYNMIKSVLKITKVNSIAKTKNGKLLITSIRTPVEMVPVMILLKRNIVIFISSRPSSRRCRFTSRNHYNVRDRRDNKISKVETVA